MKRTDCTRIESLLPLHAGGDLSDREAAQVEAHLAVCAGCRNDLAELRDDRAWLTGLAATAAGAPEFHDAQLAAMRATVLDEIERARQPFAWAWLTGLRPARWAVAGLGLLLAFGALAFWLQRAVAPNELVALPPAPEPVVATYRSPSSLGLVIDERRATQARRRLDRRRYGSPRAPHQVEPAPLLAALPDDAPLVPTADEPRFTDAAPAPEPLRIEIQTADPNIRIIWLASSADAAALHPPTTK